METILRLLKEAGFTPVEVLLALGMLYLFREGNVVKKNLVECYKKMNQTLSDLPKQIMSMAVSFTEHRSDGIHVTGDAVISGHDTTKSDISYEPIVSAAMRAQLEAHDKAHKREPDAP